MTVLQYRLCLGLNFVPKHMNAIRITPSLALLVLSNTQLLEGLGCVRPMVFVVDQPVQGFHVSYHMISL